MIRFHNRYLGLLGLAVLAGCGSPAPAPAAGSAPAVKVQAPVKEADLTKVTLTPEAERRLGIETAAVERQQVVRTRNTGGEVIAPSGARTAVSAPFAGVLEAASGAPAAGSVVAKGHVIFRLVPIAPAERDANVDAERAAGEAAARQDMLTKKVQRAEMMAREGAGSRRAVEEAQAELATANADLKAARDRLALVGRSNATPGGLSLETPFAGLLQDIHAGAGQTVPAGTPLYDIVRLDPMWIRVPLFVGEAGDIDTRAAARIVGLGEPADAPGRTAQPVSAPPSADPSTAAIDLYFSLPNQGDQLRPGQRVSVRLARRGAIDSLVVPRAALLHDANGGTWVYEAAGAHVFIRRRVAVSDLVGSLAILERGPAPGTKVVIAGAAELFGTEFGAGK